jgi:hypothetical protein
MFGASDDLIEFRGAIDDEAGAYSGGRTEIDSEGLFPDFDQLDHGDEQEMECYFKRKLSKPRFAINALWCKEPGYSWTFETKIPHATFEIVEYGKPYCRGIVFEMPK